MYWWVESWEREARASGLLLMRARDLLLLLVPVSLSPPRLLLFALTCYTSLVYSNSFASYSSSSFTLASFSLSSSLSFLFSSSSSSFPARSSFASNFNSNSRAQTNSNSRYHARSFTSSSSSSAPVDLKWLVTAANVALFGFDPCACYSRATFAPYDAANKHSLTRAFLSVLSTSTRKLLSDSSLSASCLF